jgi:hypothetical protein|tara:strand:- start:305 stop:715 length:411 start_codon:yes stop_codon:yes gene_type:complete
MKQKNKRKPSLVPPSVEEILSQVTVPQELAHLPCFQETWAEWVAYKQEEAMCDTSGTMKPWRTIQAAQREMSHIRNKHNSGRDAVHVIAESMRNQWIGIRFDLISDRQNQTMPKSKDQVSALDLEWSKLNNPNQLN